MYVCSFKCLDTVFDFHDNEKVLVRHENKYYMTPKNLAQVEAWIIETGHDKIRTQDQLDFIISKGWLKSYV